jgi:2-polyprenyl-3-methyl-5-hydroxy-6-metoxy-1,4-benzoquinol methylase
MVAPDDLVLAYQNYYTVAGASPTGKSGVGLSDWFIRLDRVLTRLLDLQPERDRHGDTYLDVSTPGRLLDVGCGSGEFLTRMRQKGWRVQGTEFDPEAARKAGETHGIDVDLGDICDIGYAAEQFDAITARHVIEHVRDPGLFLAECWRILKPGGRLVFLTPNADSLGHRHFRARWRGLEQPRHLYLFNPRSMRAVFERRSVQGADVFSSAQGATFTLNASAKTSRGMIETAIDRCAIGYLQIRETILTRRGVQVGEDLVAIAMKPLKAGVA